MDTDGALVIDLQQPDWAARAPEILADLINQPPNALRIEADGAPVPSADAGQLLLVLMSHAETTGIPVETSGFSDDLQDGLGRIGFAAALSVEGDALK